MNAAVALVERGLVPDSLTRWGIRRLCTQRLDQVRALDAHNSGRSLQRFAEAMDRAPIAPLPEKANQQHYELPAGFFECVLGPRMKYSGCYYERAESTLAQAEEAALAQVCTRAGLQDGMDVLELGCGWGSLSLWIAEHYPHCRITAVSNSSLQKAFIDARMPQDARGRLEVLTADMNEFQAPRRYDRVMSIEMFEHMRNYARLLQRIADWLNPQGRLFVHVFAHQDYAYEFQSEGSANWIGRHFFTGGIMPADSLLPQFQDDLRLLKRWRLGGEHYQRTAEDWLHNLDAHQAEILPVLESVYGTGAAARWYQRWRVFFLSCAELFGYRRGNEWGVSHYLFEKP